MAELAVERTYGSALFQAAKELNRKEEFREEITALRALFEQETEFMRFACAPSVSIAEKQQTVREILTGKVCPEMLNFLDVLIEKNRMRCLSGIARAYNELADAEEGVILGEIYSVVPLSQEQLAKFEADTGKLLSSRVKLKNEIDKSLIGGVRIFADGKMIDASVRSRMTALRETIVE